MSGVAEPAEGAASDLAQILVKKLVEVLKGLMPLTGPGACVRIESVRKHLVALSAKAEAAAALSTLPRAAPTTSSTASGSSASGSLKPAPSRHLLYECPSFALLLLKWPPGAVSAIHDHPVDGCIFSILKGRLLETTYAFRSDDGNAEQAAAFLGMLDSSESTAMRRTAGAAGGAACGLGTGTASGTCTAGSASGDLGHYHCQWQRLTASEPIELPQNAVSSMIDNVGAHRVQNASKAEAVSVHVYAPPLRDCNVYTPLDPARPGDARGDLHSVVATALRFQSTW